MPTIDDLDSFIHRRFGFIGAFAPWKICATVHANMEVDMTAATAYRKRFNAASTDVKATFNDLILKAAGNALPHHRLYTCCFNGVDTLYPVDVIDIRFPVDVGDGLLGWGVVREADKKTLREIALESQASKEVAQRESPARQARFDAFLKTVPFLGPVINAAIEGLLLTARFVPALERWLRVDRRIQRGTFLITNVGPAGIRRMEGPIVTPDIFHLMIAATHEVPALVDGKLVGKPMMPLIAKFDNRVTDVPQVARFLSEVKQNLEDPEHRLGPY